MSADSPDEAPMAALSGSQKPSHKPHHHRQKSELGKRARRDDNADDGRGHAMQKHKKAKKGAEDEVSAPAEQQQREKGVGSAALAKQTKRSKKHDASQVAPGGTPVEVAPGMTKDTTELVPLGEGVEAAPKKSKRPRHSNKKRHSNLDDPAPERASPEDQAPRVREKKSRKSKDDKGGDSALSQGRGKGLGADEGRPMAGHTDLMDVDTSATPQSKDDAVLRPSHAPHEVEFPFFKQFLSLFVPLYPIGFSKPVTSAAEQHLAPMLNHYSSLLQGVVLGYRNPCIAEQARHPKEPATDDTPAILESIGEYAVGFGRLTAEVDLFKPSRGAWMEGEIVLQSEGNVGVKCFERFNASIEARRLPPGWKWVDLYGRASGDGLRSQTAQNRQGEGSEEDEGTERSSMQGDGGFAGGDDDQLAHQMHVTGYWVDAGGRRVRGKVWFQIKSYETGLAGDYGYISIVGTMLNEEEERQLDVQQRLDKRQRHRRLGGLLRPESRRVPEFSMTTFGKEDEEESSEQRQVVSKSRPSTPDD